MGVVAREGSRGYLRCPGQYDGAARPDGIRSRSDAAKRTDMHSRGKRLGKLFGRNVQHRSGHRAVPRPALRNQTPYRDRSRTGVGANFRPLTFLPLLVLLLAPQQTAEIDFTDGICGPLETLVELHLAASFFCQGGGDMESLNFSLPQQG